MVQSVNYWYDAQIRFIIMNMIRLFSNFYISDGKDANGNDKLRRIACTFLSTDKSAAAQLTKNTDTFISSAPRMILTIQSLSLNDDKSGGSPYYNYESEITEKKFNEDSGDYEYEAGNSYHITRLNPVPLGLTFKLYILSTMVSQKLQLLEQIRTLFTPSLELQVSENPLDWNRIINLTMTGINWTSKGEMNLESTTFDMMDFTFEMETHLNLPAIVEHSKIIENIITQINTDSLEDSLGWDLNTVIQEWHTPSYSSIMIDDNNIVTFIPNEKCKNWYQLLKSFGCNYNSSTSNVILSCTSDDNTITGKMVIDTSNPLKAKWNINESTMPKTNIPNVNSIIDPHSFIPTNEEGTRYLITESISTDTKTWGKLYNNYGEETDIIDANCIIEYKNGFWTITTNPEDEPATYYVSDCDDYKYIYTYNYNYHCWVDVINKKYRMGSWRISY